VFADKGFENAINKDVLWVSKRPDQVGGIMGRFGSGSLAVETAQQRHP